MTHVLYLEASPRGADSVSSRAAQYFLEALPGSAQVTHLNLYEQQLPEFGATLAAAKYQIMAGQELAGVQRNAWDAVESLVAEFLAADLYLLSVPMWNLGIPYKLKQYIDLITHPGLTFEMSAEGMQGKASGAACVIYSRGGDYSPSDGKADPFDFQSVYLRAWLGMVGISDVNDVLLQRTLAGPEALQSAMSQARTELQQLATQLAS